MVNDLGTRSGADAASVVAEIVERGGTAVADTGSATWDGAAGIVAHAIDAFGRVDVLVNNATAGRNNDIWRFTEEEWDLTVGVNLKGYFAMIREAAPHFCRQGSGAIVNTSSGSGFGHPSHVAYAAAKEGVVGLTRTVARELGRFGVRCNAIRPLAVGASTAEYEVRTARWATLMALTMAPRGAKPPANRRDSEIDLRQDRAARGVAVHRRRPRGERTHVPHRRRHDLATRASRSASACSPTPPDGRSTRSIRSRPTHLVDDLVNEYTLDDHPELKEFDA